MEYQLPVVISDHHHGRHDHRDRHLVGRHVGHRVEWYHVVRDPANPGAGDPGCPSGNADDCGDPGYRATGYPGAGGPGCPAGGVPANRNDGRVCCRHARK